MMHVTRKWQRAAASVLGFVLFQMLAGCISAPKETVELTEIVGRQIAEMESSHEKFVRLYYAKLRNEVDQFMENRWIPQFLNKVVEGKEEGGKQFRAALDKAYKLATLDWNQAVRVQGIQDPEVKSAVVEALKKVAAQERATLGAVLLDFSLAAQKEINDRRRTLIQPIDEQERFVLEQLREGYADLLRGNAAIKAHLESVVKVVSTREQLLQKAGLLEEQKKLVNLAVNLSDGAMKVLGAAKGADQGIQEFLARMKDVKAQLKSAVKPGE